MMPACEITFDIIAAQSPKLLTQGLLTPSNPPRVGMFSSYRWRCIAFCIYTFTIRPFSKKRKQKEEKKPREVEYKIMASECFGRDEFAAVALLPMRLRLSCCAFAN